MGIMIPIGGLDVSNVTEETIRTLALGSCIAVIIYDPLKKVAGMIHFALPDSKANPDKAEVMPGYFADTGIPLLLEKMVKLGAELKNSWVIEKGTNKTYLNKWAIFLRFL